MEKIDYKILKYFFYELQTHGMSFNQWYVKVDDSLIEKINIHYDCQYELGAIIISKNRMIAKGWIQTVDLAGDMIKLTEKGYGIISSKIAKEKKDAEMSCLDKIANFLKKHKFPIGLTVTIIGGIYKIFSFFGD